MLFKRRGQFYTCNVSAILNGKTAARPLRVAKLDMTCRKYSEYFELQEREIKQRYIEEPDIVPCTDAMVDVEYPDIYNYLINTIRPISKEELKAYKNLDGYKYLMGGSC